MVDVADPPAPSEEKETADEHGTCCEHCEANRKAIATLAANQAALAGQSEDAALESLGELLEVGDADTS